MLHRLAASAALILGALTLSVPAVADTDHQMGDTPATHTAEKGMTVRLRVTNDAMKGWNLNVRTRAFRWAPEHASTAHRRGEGHAHLYVDGVKITRIYGPWHYVGELKPGKHVLRVTLNGNDHGDYVRAGKPLAASTTVTVP